MKQVFSFTEKREIKGEQASNDEKLFSIYELHTDIIVKGLRKWEFGHKVSFAGGKSNLLLDVQIFSGNPSDTNLLESVLDRVKENYGKTTRCLAVDGGYASFENVKYAQGEGILNIVFNKVVGSLRSVASSKNMETRLKKWRSGIEAVISNYKRKFNMRRCNWKGRVHFDAKVLWAALAYNIRVMAGLVMEKLEPQV